MPKPLTAVAIQNLKPKRRRYEISDGGCIGLRVAVFPTKRKSFVVRFRRMTQNNANRTFRGLKTYSPGNRTSRSRMA